MQVQVARSAEDRQQEKLGPGQYKEKLVVVGGRVEAMVQNSTEDESTFSDAHVLAASHSATLSYKSPSEGNLSPSRWVSQIARVSYLLCFCNQELQE